MPTLDNDMFNAEHPIAEFEKTAQEKKEYSPKKLKKLEELITILEKNTPTSPDKWAKAKAAARAKFDVYPSAYANLWAAKKYKSMGGKWKRGKK